MPSNPRKTPSGSRKKVTASARAKVSTRKIRKKNHNQEGSFLHTGVVSTVSTSSPQPGPSSTDVQGSNEVMLSMLAEIKASNQLLSDRMTKLERKESLVSPSPSQTHVQSQGKGFQQGHQRTSASFNPHLNHSPKGVQNVHTTLATEASHNIDGFPHIIHHRQANFKSGMADLPRDAVLPSLEVMRRLPNVSQAVSGVLASYDQQNRQDSMQGKPHRRSGRYNNYDTVSAPPEVRWPNEGFHGSNGKKRLLYDDLSMPQWVAGQLTNILHMHDHNISKQALVQVIAAMKDASSIPFSAVKNAWACSMHELEEGNLSWGDSTQWALNRLSASQVSMINSQSVSQKKFCKYFNKGSCSHDSHHGLYKHNCSFCGRQGRTANHSENKCNFKNKKQDKGVASST